MTTQIAEQLVFKGQSYAMPGCIWLPITDGRVHELFEKQLQDAMEQDESCFSTACWRNYMGTWEVMDDRLYLKSIQGMYRITDGQPIFADWFTDKLCLPFGELLDYNLEIGYMHYAKELQLSFDNGVLIDCQIVDNDTSD